MSTGGGPIANVQAEQTSTTEPEHRHPADGERISLARTFGGRSALREIVETVLLAVIVFLALNTATGRFQVRGSSMQPALQNGQYLVISKLTYWIHPPERGDVIVFHPPINPAEDYIKRIVGLPGEQIQIQGGEVWVDSVRLDEVYITNPTSYSGSWNLEEDEYFVLGDNRGNSSDSHTWGVLPEENVAGKAWISYWPPKEWGLVTHHSFLEPEDQGE